MSQKSSGMQLPQFVPKALTSDTAIVTLLRYAERAASLTNGLALRQGHLGFAQHADNLFRGVAFTAHFVLLSRGQNAPNSLNKSGPLLGGHSSTTFLILIVFNPRGLESMFVKSMIGDAMTIAVGYLVYRLVMRGLERRFIRNLARSAGGLVDGPAVGLDRVPVEHVADPGSGQHRGLSGPVC